MKSVFFIATCYKDKTFSINFKPMFEYKEARERLEGLKTIALGAQGHVTYFLLEFNVAAELDTNGNLKLYAE